MKLSVLIPSYKRLPLAVRHVEECMKGTILPDEIVVVNDGGPIELRDMLFAIPRKVPITYARIEEDILWNYNGAVNLAFWLSQGDVIAIEDVDHIPDRTTYEVGLKAIEANPEAGRISFGRKIVNIADVPKPMEEWKVTGTMGTNQMVAFLRRDVYLRMKGQDERFAGNYGWMSYDFPFRRDKILKTISKKEFYYWAVLGDEGEPGLKRGLSGANLKIYRDNVRNGKPHSMHGILNFHYDFERWPINV